MTGAIEKITREISEKQVGTELDDEDLKKIRSSYEKNGGTEQDLLLGSMASFINLKDSIVGHLRSKSSMRFMPELILASTLKVQRKILERKISHD